MGYTSGMKQLYVLALALLVTAAPALAQSPLAANADDRQAIADREFELNWVGVPPTRQTQLESQITQIETKINTNGEPNLPVPVYGSCDAVRGLIAYLQDQLSTNLDYQQQVDDQRAIHDLQVNLGQRGC